MLNLEPFGWRQNSPYFLHMYNNTTRCSLNTQTNPKEKKKKSSLKVVVVHHAIILDQEVSG
jgi:hypothetical protein